MIQESLTSKSCDSFLDIYVCIENEEFHTKVFDKRDNFVFDIVKIPFYSFIFPNKMFYGKIGVEFLKIFRANSKTEDLSQVYKLLLSRMLK